MDIQKILEANASSLDHLQLDGSVTLHADDISDWGNLMIALNKKYSVKILGGGCGTSVEHLKYIVRNINSGKDFTTRWTYKTKKESL